MEEIRSLLKEFIPNVDLSEGEILYQLMKIAAMREETEIQIPMQELVDNLSLPLSYGEMLRMHLSNLGVYVINGRKSTGDFKITGTPDSTEISQGSVVTTGSDVSFVTTEPGIMLYSVPVTRGEGSSDSLPTGYLVDSIAWIDSSEFGDGTRYYGATYSDGTITWDGGENNPSTGQRYYVRPVEDISIIISARAIFVGTDGNITAGTEATMSQYPLVEVESYTGFTGGSNFESDTAARTRGLNSRYRSRNRNSLETLIENLGGVQEVMIEETLGVDQAIPPDWSQGEPEDENENELTFITLTQEFSPSTGIASIRGVDLRLAKPSADYAGTIVVSLQDDLGSTLESTTITQDDFDYLKGTDIQTIRVPLKHAPIFSTDEYRINVSQSGTFKIGYYSSESFNEGNFLEAEDYGLPAKSDISFRTLWLSNAYKVHVLKESGYSFADVENEIDNLIDIDGSGFSTAGVEHVILEINEDFIQVRAKIFTKPGYVYIEISNAIETSVRTFLQSLGIGENIPYLGIIGAIMSVPGVHNISTVSIYKDSSEVSNSTNMNSVSIEDGHKAIPDTPLVVLQHGNP